MESLEGVPGGSPWRESLEGVPGASFWRESLEGVLYRTIGVNGALNVISGGGKTFTMVGTPDSPGIMVRKVGTPIIFARELYYSNYFLIITVID